MPEIQLTPKERQELKAQRPWTQARGPVWAIPA